MVALNSYWGIEIKETWGFELQVGTEMIIEAIKFGAISYDEMLLHIFFEWLKAIRPCLVYILKTKYTFYDSVSYIKLFMTTMKMKKGNQYKIQKSQNGGGNNLK